MIWLSPISKQCGVYCDLAALPGLSKTSWHLFIYNMTFHYRRKHHSASVRKQNQNKKWITSFLNGMTKSPDFRIGRIPHDSFSDLLMHYIFYRLYKMQESIYIYEIFIPI